jgi:SAM-dependent methyltransferase
MVLDLHIPAIMNLNLGSGVHPAPDWVNVDMNVLDDWQVDVVASVLYLPFTDEVADRAYFGHVLEHLSYLEDAPGALAEAWRVLKPGGELGVVGPAMDLAIETGQPDWLLEAIRMNPDLNDTSGLGHKWEANVENTLHLVQFVFPNARVVPVADISRDSGWPNTATASWQVAIIASKS